MTSSTSNYHFFALFIALLVFINNQQVSANSLSSKSGSQRFSPTYNDLSYENIDDSELSIPINRNSLYRPNNEEIISRNPWSQLIHRYSDRPNFPVTSYSPRRSGFALRNGEILYIPFPDQKRAIPIGFQKALFAHGIVGRR